MGLRFRVTYSDGRDVVVRCSPRAQVMTEQHFAGIPDTRKIEASYYLAWASLHKAELERNDFEQWLDLIDNIEEVMDKPDPPTPAAPSSEPLSG